MQFQFVDLLKVFLHFFYWDDKKKKFCKILIRSKVCNKIEEMRTNLYWESLWAHRIFPSCFSSAMWGFLLYRLPICPPFHTLTLGLLLKQLDYRFQLPCLCCASVYNFGCVFCDEGGKRIAALHKELPYLLAVCFQVLLSHWALHSLHVASWKSSWPWLLPSSHCCPSQRRRRDRFMRTVVVSHLSCSLGSFHLLSAWIQGKRRMAEIKGKHCEELERELGEKEWGEKLDTTFLYLTLLVMRAVLLLRLLAV